MPKVNFYHRYSDLDKLHEFGVVDGGCGSAYLMWVFFYLGVYIGREYKKVRLFPFKIYSWENPVKIYKINDAERCAQLITQRIKKILNNSQAK
jgi:hypothetical protein